LKQLRRNIGIGRQQVSQMIPAISLLPGFYAMRLTLSLDMADWTNKIYSTGDLKLIDHFDSGSASSR